MAEVLIVVLGFLGLVFGAGWFLGFRSARRRQGRAAEGVVRSPTAYDEAFDAGFRAGRDADPRIPQTAPAPHAQDPAAGRATLQRVVVSPDRTSEPLPVLQPARSPEELAAEKAARDVRTVNIALYSASLLLVAAGGLFIGAGLPGPARAVTISVVVMLFYVGGLVLHTHLPRLRPAAVAFAGTGLALLPVGGLLFGALTGEGALAWFVSAVLGSGAYVVAAVRLQSRVVAYLSLPFFLSIALSSAALLGAALIWYFTSSIAVAAVLAVVSAVFPHRLPAVMTRAVLDAHRFLAPLALVMSLVLGGILADRDRALLWVVGAGYYGALLLVLPVRRVENLYALRLVSAVAAFLVTIALGAGAAWAVLVLGLVLGLQVTGLLVLPLPLQRMLRTALPAGAERPGEDRRPRVPEWYRLDVLITFGLMTLAATVVTLAPLVPSGSTGGARPDALLPALLVLLVGAFVATGLRGGAELLVLPGVVLAVLGPWSDPWRAEVVIILSLGYFVARAGRTSRDTRERFLLAARSAMVVLLPLIVLVHARTPGSSGGRLWDLAALALVLGAVANQLVEAVRVRRGSTSPYGTRVICVASGVSLPASILLAGSAGGGAITATAVGSCVLVGCATTLLLPLADEEGPGSRWAGRLRSDPGTATQGGGRIARSVRQSRAGEAIGPLSFLAAALAFLAATASLRSYELLLGAIVLYSGLMAGRSITRGRRGAYLLAAQAALTSLTAVVSADLELSVHGVLTATAVSVAAQEVVRSLLRRRLRAIGLQSWSAWSGLALLAALPLLYGALAGSDVRLGVVVLQLALLLVVSAIVFVLQREELAAYPALYAAAALVAALTGVLRTAPDGWLPRAPLDPWAGALVAAGLVLVLALLRLRLDDRRIVRPGWAGIGVLGAEAAAFAFEDGTGWDRVVVAAVLAGVGFAVSRWDGLPWVDAGAAVAVVVLSTTIVQQLVPDVTGTPGISTQQILLGAVLAGGLLQLARSVLPPAGHEPLRHLILTAVALGWGGVAAAAAMVPDDQAVLGSVVLAAVAVLTVRELPTTMRGPAREGAFLVLAASAQRVTWLLLDGPGFYWAAQWWVVALSLLSLHSFTRGHGGRGPLWLSAAAVVLSGTGLLTLPGGTPGTQIWALFGHVALLAAGVALSRRLFSVWGAVGIALALLWFLRDYTFVLLTLAAVALIAFAVWKLNRQTRGATRAAPGASAVTHTEDA
ncbi:hypothetical protein [uncultured Arthrobacter sp.]|uniref:hypothetical protein n=1 Tax=uncultured Arthrobacter sp. TaxID=114050 RepID=UPI0026223823|nr:hypothetical protein [uncultured Arthrobacter sp.]